MQTVIGSLLVISAALLWATDSLFRFPISGTLDASLIVFIEHCICVLFLSPVVFIKYRQKITHLTAKEWFSLNVIGAGGSAIATIFFTASFRCINPSIAILLQKLQPLFVFMLARIFLKEKIKPSFYFYALLAIFGALLLSLPSFNLKDLTSIELKSKGIFFALSAAFLWAIATVVGKSVLHRLPALVVTYWRFVFGLITLAGLMLAAHISFPTETLRQPQVIRSLFYMGLFPGLIAMTLYYFGMKKISAHLTTVMELVFPISAIIINTYVLHLPLTTIQMVGAAILIFSVTITTLQHR